MKEKLPRDKLCKECLEIIRKAEAEYMKKWRRGGVKKTNKKR